MHTAEVVQGDIQSEIRFGQFLCISKFYKQLAKKYFHTAASLDFIDVK